MLKIAALPALLIPTFAVACGASDRPGEESTTDGVAVAKGTGGGTRDGGSTKDAASGSGGSTGGSAGSGGRTGGTGGTGGGSSGGGSSGGTGGSSGGPVRVVSVGSQGYTPEAASLVNAMALQNPVLFAHSGDVDFSFSDFTMACSRWPDLPYYCNGSLPAHTGDEIRAGWRSIMAPVFPTFPTIIAWGNHEHDGMKFNEIQPYYLDLFHQPEAYKSTVVNVGTKTARLIFVDPAIGFDTGPQRDWFDAELAQPDDWHIVIAHGQPWSQNKPALTLQPTTCGMQFDAWIGGHPLAYERTKQGRCHIDANGRAVFDVVNGADNVTKGAGRVFVSNGGGGMHVCGTWDQPPINSLEDWMADVVCYDYTFVVLEWSADGLSLTIKALDKNSAVRDQVTLS